MPPFRVLHRFPEQISKKIARVNECKKVYCTEKTKHDLKKRSNFYDGSPLQKGNKSVFLTLFDLSKSGLFSFGPKRLFLSRHFTVICLR